MNYSELLAALVQRLQLPKAEVEKRLDETTAIITAELVKDNLVSIVNFGIMEVKKRQERVSIHPNTGKKLLVPPKLHRYSIFLYILNEFGSKFHSLTQKPCRKDWLNKFCELPTKSHIGFYDFVLN